MNKKQRKFTITITLGPKSEALMAKVIQRMRETQGLDLTPTDIASAATNIYFEQYAEMCGWAKGSVPGSCHD